MNQELADEMVWIVSFAVDDDGTQESYLIEEKNLAGYRRDIADNLRDMLGKGLFYSKEEATKWAEAQVSRPCCGKSGGCCRQQNNSQSKKY